MYSYQMPHATAPWDLRLTRSTHPRMRRNEIRPATVLKAILAPEPSDGLPSTLLSQEILETKWLGPVKTLFWTAVSIGLVVLLATFCS